MSTETRSTTGHERYSRDWWRITQVGIGGVAIVAVAIFGADRIIFQGGDDPCTMSTTAHAGEVNRIELVSPHKTHGDITVWKEGEQVAVSFQAPDHAEQTFTASNSANTQKVVAFDPESQLSITIDDGRVKTACQPVTKPA